jgi:hypothetical protein
VRGICNRIEGRFNFVVIESSRIRKGDMPGLAHEQLLAEKILESLNLVADCGRGDCKLDRGTSEIRMARSRVER